MAGSLLSRPAPDGLICVEVWAVARQSLPSWRRGFTNLRSQSGVRKYSRNASPRCAGALSQITYSRPPCLLRNCSRKATEVPELLLPSNSIHSTSPVSKHTAE